MKKWDNMKTIGLMVFLALLPFGGFSQITSLDWADFPPIGTQAVLLGDTTGHVPVTITPGGANQVWGYQMPLSGREIPYEIVLPSATPYASSVPGAEWALQSKQWLSLPAVPPLIAQPIEGFFSVYYYQKYDAGQNAVLGVGIGAELLSYYTGGAPYASPSLDFPFPLTLGKTWTKKAVYTVPTKISGATLPVTFSDSTLMEVDATGQLTIPVGTFPCMRIKLKRYVKVSTFLFTQSIVLSQDTVIQYEWYAKKVGLLLQVSSHGGEKNEQFTEAGLVVRLVSSSALTGVDCSPECLLVAQRPSFHLYANYPNPFNPETKITYDIAKPSWVELKIYSLIGQEVAVLVSELQGQGTYSVAWNGKDRGGRVVPSGIYFCQLKAIPVGEKAPFVQTRKLILTQ